MVPFKLIAAACDDMGIGINNTLPWKLSTQSNTEKKNAVIMGRKTWQSIPLKYRPLKDRLNIVLSRSTGLDFTGATFVAHSLQDAIEQLESSPHLDIVESAWVIGGEQIYKSAMQSNRCDRIYLTRIDAHYVCDTFFPAISSDNFKLVSDPEVPDQVQSENGIRFKYEVYARL